MKTGIKNPFTRLGGASCVAWVTLALLAGGHQTTAQVLTNIVVSPDSPVIGVGSNQQFTATGKYDDGSSQVLTNGGGSGGSWTVVAGVPSAVSAVACAAVNGELYVVGGTGQEVYDYDPSMNSWTNKASFINSWCSFSGAAGIANKLYIMGGCAHSDCGNGKESRLTVYDAVANSWSNGAPMSVARSMMAVGVINGKIYVAGGDTGYNTAFDSLEVYDPASNVWTVKTSMPTARRMMGGAGINGIFYVVGGMGSSLIYSAVEAYDPTTDTWTTKAPMPTPRFFLGVTTVGGLLYAIGGYVNGGTSMTNLVEVYDPVANSWSTGVLMLNAAQDLQPVAINGTIYVVGVGPYNSSSRSTNVEAFTPSQSSLWSSSSPTVASINTNGLASGLTNGATTITATSGSVSGNTTLTVVSPPSIAVQPTNNTVSPNGSVTLSVGATGGGLSYQWQFNGTNITGATGASLTITNVSAADVGVYTVIVNNAAGSVTSSSATLASVDIKMFAGVIVDGPLGSNYLIQATSNLLSSWTTLTNVALPTQPYIYIDYSSPTNSKQFYRAVPQ